MKKFNYFPNHGDEDGSGCYTICYGFPDSDEIIIVGLADRAKDARESCKRLNAIIEQITVDKHRGLYREAVLLLSNLSKKQLRVIIKLLKKWFKYK